jgi:aerobic C4-dicarboxylate transport protein
VATIVVSKWEHELDHDQLAAELIHPSHLEEDKELFPVREAA